MALNSRIGKPKFNKLSKNFKREKTTSGKHRSDTPGSNKLNKNSKKEKKSLKKHKSDQKK